MTVMFYCSDNTKSEKGKSICINNKDCGSGFICSNGKCIIADVSSSNLCKNDLDCKGEEQCIYGECVIITEDAGIDIYSEIEDEVAIVDTIDDEYSLSDVLEVIDAGVDNNEGTEDSITEDIVDIYMVDTYFEDAQLNDTILDIGCVNNCAAKDRIYCNLGKYQRCKEENGCLTLGPEEECNTPPANICINSETLRIFEKIGKCNDSNIGCEYGYSENKCPNGCENGMCKNCTPNCTNKECGSDGCGGECLPGCKANQGCVNGKCTSCNYQKYGYDFNLTKRCIKTVCDNSSPYYFEDVSQCDSSSSWLIAVESEASLGASCPGPANCSFKINAQDSPVSLEWMPHSGKCGDNYSVHMLVDHSAFPSSCQGDYWTWFAFMDHTQTGGGPYPHITKAVSHHMLNYNDFTPTPDSSARVFIGAQWWYKGKARTIEFNLFLSQWGDADPHPGLIVKFDLPDLEFIALDASYWNMNIQKGVDTEVNIPWITILQDAIKNGWLADPGSWDNVVTMSYFIGVEVKNRGIASLWHTDFRIQDTIQ
ncbi:MAG: DUF7107 domain-containing protein [Myxococcota bacterium]